MLDIILLKHSRRFTTSPPGVMQQTKAEHHSHSNSDWSTRSHNSFLLRWERCHKAQVAIQLFDEHDNYFSHMPRRFKAPALNPTSGRGGLRPKTLFATNKPWLLTFSLFIICSFISRCLPFFFFLNRSHLGHSFDNPGSRFPHQPPPLSHSLDYGEPESGKVSLWKQGQRQWRALHG